MAEPIPSLDSAGWITDPAITADRLLAYYTVADYSQSYAFYGQVKSLPRTIADTHKDTLKLKERIRNEIFAIYNAYFDETTCDVTTSNELDATGKETGRINITLFVVLTRDRKKYSLGRLIQSVDGKIKAINEINR